jgi:hypothetical protein
MNILPSNAARYGMFRAFVFLFALLLGCQAIWILTAEYYRPSAHGFPENSRAAAAAAANRKDAALAASFGFIRGDLWSEYALTYINLVQPDGAASDDAHNSKTVEEAREAAHQALALAPHDARVWLVLAGIDARFDQRKHRPAATLRMSFYTGANEIDLIPLRLFLAVNSPALADDDFRQLVKHDIRVLVTHRPELKPAIQAAYQHATPLGQQFLEETLKEIDSALLGLLQHKGS